MPTITGSPVTLDSLPIEGAEIAVIDNETGEVLGETTTDANGEWKIWVETRRTIHILAEYEDQEGNTYQDHSKPYVRIEDPQVIGDPAAFWQHSEGSGTQLRDFEGDRDGELVGSTWETGAGYGDTHLSHEAGAYANLGTWTIPNTNGAFSIVLWVRFDDPLGSSQPFFGSGGPTVRIHKSGSGDDVYARYHGTNTVDVIPASALTDGWHMCVVTRAEDGTAKGYYDNQGVHDTGSWTALLGEDEHHLASNPQWSATFNGATDYTLIYDRQLTEQEILDIYNATSANYPVGSPAAWWKFNEGGGPTLGDSAGTQDATISGATWEDGAGYRDTYLSFDGTDDYASLGAWTPPTTNGAFSFVGWTYVTDAFGPSRSVFGNRDNAFRIHKSGSQDVFYIEFYATNQITIVPTADMESNRWYMLVATRDETGTVNTYFNNAGLQTTGSETPNAFPEVEYQFGNSTTTDNPYSGGIDYTLWYDYAISEQDVLDIYNSTSPHYPGH